MIKTVALLLFAAAAPVAASAQGIVIPIEPDLPPLGIERHAVRTDIDHQAAVTVVEQVFVNNTTRRLEAQYVFPIPKGAALTGFTLQVDGKETSGEMVGKDDARKLYHSLVQRTRDAGLLEWLGGDVFRANIHPIEPSAKQTVTLRFASALPAEGGLIRYVHPVRAGARRGPTVLGESRIEVSIRGPRAIENLYSPSHPILISRPNDREARIAWSQAQSTLHRDFELYWSAGGKDMALDLVTHRPDPSEAGYFMMLISPGSRLQADRVVERDVVFVVDTSGSMAGEKIEQARHALKHCVMNLNDGDRFDIVRFSTDVEAWKGAFVSAKEMKESGAGWVGKFKAAGGTNIAGALKAALAYPVDPTRPGVVVFLTDGKPTMGDTTHPGEIVSRTAAARAASVRIFTFGVGYDVNTHLLDGISETGRGVSEYVRPEEDIAVKVGTFWGKAGRPVLTDLALEVTGDKVKLAQIHPSPFPDLFSGSQFVLFGRYTGDGPAGVRLTGTVNGAKKAFDYQASFAAKESKFSFVEPLWARRHIGSLLDAIRLHGESKEIVDEVVALAKRFGIQTPYTSWIIADDAATGKYRLSPLNADADGKVRAIWAANLPAAPAADRAEEERMKREDSYEASKVIEGFTKKEGKDAVEAAASLRHMKEADRAGARPLAIVTAAGTRFVRYHFLWVDERFEAEAELTTVKFGSAAYFKLIEKKPALIDALKLGPDVVYVTAKGKALAVTGAGIEEISDGQIDGLFQAVVK